MSAETIYTCDVCKRNIKEAELTVYGHKGISHVCTQPCWNLMVDAAKRITTESAEVVEDLQRQLERTKAEFTKAVETHGYVVDSLERDLKEMTRLWEAGINEAVARDARDVYAKPEPTQIPGDLDSRDGERRGPVRRTADKLRAALVRYW